MAFARHGEGIHDVVKALISQIHPVFMLPPLAASWFGSMITSDFSLGVGLLHMTAIFFAVYTAHVKDGYVDFHIRDEDDDHPLTISGCQIALLGATVGFMVSLSLLYFFIDIWAVIVTLPTWLIAYHHAPQLDMHPIGATMGYPTGIGLAVVGGYYVQIGRIDPIALTFALVFVVVLTGVKIIDDIKDHQYDRWIGKRTVAVLLGPNRARRFANIVIGIGLLLLISFVLIGHYPLSIILATLPIVLVMWIARKTTSTVATMLLIRACYVFFAIILGIIYFRPFTGGF